MIQARIFRVAVASFAVAAFATAVQAQDKPAAKPAAPKPATPAAAPASGGEQPMLLGQYGDWGAYKASPGGKTVCFALAKPSTGSTEPAGRKRDQAYMFVSTRPGDKVKNEVSAIVGYTQRTGGDTTATVGAQNYALYAQNDGAWLKNTAEEAQMIDNLRKGQEVVIKSVSSRGTKSSDTYTLKGLAQALDKVEQECK